jgi:hypothetical protein
MQETSPPSLLMVETTTIEQQTLMINELRWSLHLFSEDDVSPRRSRNQLKTNRRFCSIQAMPIFDSSTSLAIVLYHQAQQAMELVAALLLLGSSCCLSWRRQPHRMGDQTGMNPRSQSFKLSEFN